MTIRFTFDDGFAVELSMREGLALLRALRREGWVSA